MLPTKFRFIWPKLKYCVFRFLTDPIKSARLGKFLLTSAKEKKKLFGKFFPFLCGNERKLFVKFEFGILLELRTNPYRKAITTMDTTWCVGAVENRKG